VERGLKTPQAAASLTLSEAVQILMKGGVTTQSSADEVSGRGIGLDAVLAAAHRLKGNVRFDSQPGKGTALELSAPVSLSSNLAILVETAATVASIPLEAVKCAIRLQPNDISRAPEGSSIVYQGQVIPYAPLHAMLGLKGWTSNEVRPRTALVLQGNNALGAVAVDRLIGTSHVVVRQLPEAATAQPILAGVSLDAQGNPQLALDPDILVQSSLSAFPYEAAVEKAQVAPILVVDDSLTTRMLEQSILESAGYSVELATSAEEALEKAKEKPHALFIVDVEMPGMSGFDFVAKTQTDERLKNTPAVLVTSRNAPEDFERGKQAGASAYIVKGEFDQGYLLDTIRTLLGEEVRR
jgi:two-component system chemotaxis sensor kinase CheA